MQICAFNVFQKPRSSVAVDIPAAAEFYVFSEVRKQDINSYEQPKYNSAVSNSLDGLNIVLLYSQAVECIETDTLKSVNPLKIGRTPVYGRFKHEGLEIALVGLHLPRRNAPYRWLQSYLLSRWAVKQTCPVVLIGDLNCDYSTTSDSTDRCFRIFSKLLTWIRPAKLIPTQGSRHKSILDAAFVYGLQAKAECEILHPDPDYFSLGRSDHRPILLTIPTGDQTMSRSRSSRRQSRPSYQAPAIPEQDYESQLAQLQAENQKLLQDLDTVTAPTSQVPQPDVVINAIVEGKEPALPALGFNWQSVATVLSVVGIASFTQNFGPVIYNWVATRAIELYSFLTGVPYAELATNATQGVADAAATGAANLAGVAAATGAATAVAVGASLPFITPVFTLVAILSAFLGLFLVCSYLAKEIESFIYKAIPVFNATALTLATVLTLITFGYLAFLFHVV